MKKYDYTKWTTEDLIRERAAKICDADMWMADGERKIADKMYAVAEEMLLEIMRRAKS